MSSSTSSPYVSLLEDEKWEAFIEECNEAYYKKENDIIDEDYSKMVKQQWDASCARREAAAADQSKEVMQGASGNSGSDPD